MHASADFKPCLPKLRSALPGANAYPLVFALHACPHLGSAAGSSKRLAQRAQHLWTRQQAQHYMAAAHSTAG